jgi:predicted Zn-dependent peptidase
VFAGPNLVVALAGALPRGAPDLLASLFGEAPPGAAPAGLAGGAGSAPSGPAAAEAAGEPPAAGLAPAPSPPPPAGGRLELKSPIVQTYFELGNLACSYRDPDRIPLFVLANILGGGMSSRVFQAVREREGLAYTVYTYNDMGRDTGLVSCAGSCSPGKAARLEVVVRGEYARLLREGVAEEEFANNRAQIKSQLIFSLEGVTNQMSRAAKNEIFYGRFVPVAELVDQIDGLDRRELARCAAAYFDPDRLVIATHGPA